MAPSDPAERERHDPSTLPRRDPNTLQLSLLGPLTLVRDGHPLPLPPSRKVRALLAYLALSPASVQRSTLCELLWDVPNDPRAELRWTLSKIRRALGGSDRQWVETRDDGVRLDLTGCFVDALEIARAADEDWSSHSLERLQALEAMFRGDFLEGLEVERNPVFANWLTAQRRQFRHCHAALLEAIVGRVPAAESVAPLERWLALAPYELNAHELLLQALARSGRLREGEEHLAAAVRQFDAEGLDGGPLHLAWRMARQGPLQVVPPPATEQPATASTRASIAVLPFADHSGVAAYRGGTADALTEDIITRLAKLRSLFVIAQGSMFALQGRQANADAAAHALNVDYVVSGTVRSQGSRTTVHVELVEARSHRVVWSESFGHKVEDTFLVLDAIGDRIVASVSAEVETVERNRAILTPPDSLDAWQAHHRGLWHMYQHRRADNVEARRFFQEALRLDPTYSRAYAALSYTHYQDAFQRWAPLEPSVEQAYRAAADGLMADERDPAVHWAMGRALWLRNQAEESLSELKRSIDLSPNFALAHYSLAFVNCIAGDTGAAIESSDHSRELSPFDPMLFGMYGTRALALVRQGRFDEAAQAAVKAAGRPNAFPHIHAIAACCLGLAGAPEQGREHAAAARRTSPTYDLQDFFFAFPFQTADRAVFRRGAREVGLAA